MIVLNFRSLTKKSRTYQGMKHFTGMDTIQNNYQLDLILGVTLL